MPLVKPPAPDPAHSSTSSRPEASFAACQRTTFQPGLSDWYNIVTPQLIPDFEICPDCYNASIKSTQYARFTAPAGPKPDNISVKCDFSETWVRIAFAYLYTNGLPDLSLLGSVQAIQDPEGTCPNLSDDENIQKEENGKAAATRTWYCLLDPSQNGALIEDLTICSDCVAHIHTITPSLRGIFAAAAGGQKVPATCDLMVPSSPRTFEYIDQLIDAAEKTDKTGYRYTKPLADFIKKWAVIPECPKFGKVTGTKCWTFPSQVPEWTICEECHVKHVEPLYKRTPLPQILSQISPQPTVPSQGFTCQLYSDRLLEYFELAVSTNDLGSLRQKIVARQRKLDDVKRDLARLQAQHHQQLQQAAAYQQMAVMQQQSAMSTSLAWQVGWGSAGAPPDFRQSQASMAAGTEAAMQADMIASNVKLLEKEWADFWE